MGVESSTKARFTFTPHELKLGHLTLSNIDSFLLSRLIQILGDDCLTFGSKKPVNKQNFVSSLQV